MIRKIKVSDAYEICQINKESLGYSYPIESTKRQLESILSDTTHYVLIGYEDKLSNKIVGYLQAEVYRTTYFKTLFNVLGLAVLSNYQKQGIGKRLMLELEDEAIKRKIGMIRLNSGIERIEAHHFYEKLGYSGNKEQKRYTKIIEGDYF